MAQGCQWEPPALQSGLLASKVTGPATVPQLSLCCVTEGKCQVSISPQQQVMGQQQAPAALRSKLGLALGQLCAAQSNGAQGSHTSEHCHNCANCTLESHMPGDFGDTGQRDRSWDSPGPDAVR